jgi:23S rRNA pseudouridine2605 synthase
VTSTPRRPRYGLARVLSKRGLCSRSEAARWIEAGRVTVGGRRVYDAESPTLADDPTIRIDGLAPVAPALRYFALNKPRGLVTTAIDEHGRDTVYRCFDGAGLGWIAPAGRLDKASEGLLLFGNDPAWAARLTDPATGPRKTYHVQIDALPEPSLLANLVEGVASDGESLRVVSATLLRSGGRTAWLEIVLDEGRNRQIRRLLSAFDIAVLRLVRVAIGGLALGELGKGQWRELSTADLDALWS